MSETELIELIKKLVECGNALYEKSKCYKCAIHYKQELKNWKDLTNEL
jgi:hypothetical protein